MGKFKGPVIVLPRTNPDRCERLKIKLEEYKKRIVDTKAALGGSVRYIAPRILDRYFGHIPYSIYILERLFREGSVELLECGEKLAEQMKKRGQNYEQDYFNTACEIITDYIETGGRHLRRGTGLALGWLK